MKTNLFDLEKHYNIADLDLDYDRSGKKIAFIGNMGSGKTTRANYIAEKYNFVKLSFADAVRYYCNEIFNSNDRLTLQQFGDFCRTIQLDCWVNIMKKRLDKWRDFSIVIDDVRYPNEAEMLYDYGFKLVELECPMSICIDRVKKLGKYYEGAEKHRSETQLVYIKPHFISAILNTNKPLDLSIEIPELMNKLFYW